MTNFTLFYIYCETLIPSQKKNQHINTEMKTSPKSKTSQDATVEELTSI